MTILPMLSIDWVSFLHSLATAAAPSLKCSFKKPWNFFIKEQKKTFNELQIMVADDDSADDVNTPELAMNGTTTPMQQEMPPVEP